MKKRLLVTFVAILLIGAFFITGAVSPEAAEEAEKAAEAKQNEKCAPIPIEKLKEIEPWMPMDDLYELLGGVGMGKKGETYNSYPIDIGDMTTEEAFDYLANELGFIPAPDGLFHCPDFYKIYGKKEVTFDLEKIKGGGDLVLLVRDKSKYNKTDGTIEYNCWGLIVVDYSAVTDSLSE